MTQCYMVPAILESENITESKYSISSMFVCEWSKVTFRSKTNLTLSVLLVVYREGEVVVASAWEDNSVADMENWFSLSFEY